VRTGIGPFPSKEQVRLDLHTHTFASGDADTLPEEWIRAVREAGLWRAAITDHHTMEVALEMAASHPEVIVGQETLTAEGEVIGLFLEHPLTRVATARQACLQIREQGGVVYVPHPGLPKRKGIPLDTLVSLCREGLVDVVEIASSKANAVDPFQLASRLVGYGVGFAASSDAHTPSAIGSSLTLTEAFEDREGFMRAITRPELLHRCCDPQRPVAGKVVPSLQRD
jgi:predicted metal-dependent phosphoesterase TrpH